MKGQLLAKRDAFFRNSLRTIWAAVHENPYTTKRAKISAEKEISEKKDGVSCLDSCQVWLCPGTH